MPTDHERGSFMTEEIREFTPYADDDPIWDAIPTYEDCLVLIMHVIKRTIIDEYGNRIGMSMTTTEINAHNWYINNIAGLQEDLDLVGADLEDIRSRMKMEGEI